MSLPVKYLRICQCHHRELYQAGYGLIVMVILVIAGKIQNYSTEILCLKMPLAR